RFGAELDGARRVVPGAPEATAALAAATAAGCLLPAGAGILRDPLGVGRVGDAAASAGQRVADTTPVVHGPHLYAPCVGQHTPGDKPDRVVLPSRPLAPCALPRP